MTQRRGKWSDPGVPHRGWHCIDLEDLGEPLQQCEMCEAQEIRYVHHMKHPAYPKTLGVGCVCAGHMEQDLLGARARDALIQARASKRRRWLTRRWKVSAKGNEWLQTDGYRVIVYPKASAWGVTVVDVATDGTTHGRRFHPSPDRAKLAAFDFITRLLAARNAGA